jgi:hypothetical protein
MKVAEFAWAIGNDGCESRFKLKMRVAEFARAIGNDECGGDFN